MRRARIWQRGLSIVLLLAALVVASYLGAIVVSYFLPWATNPASTTSTTTTGGGPWAP